MRYRYDMVFVIADECNGQSNLPSLLLRRADSDICCAVQEFSHLSEHSRFLDQKLGHNRCPLHALPARTRAAVPCMARGGARWCSSCLLQCAGGAAWWATC